LAQWIGVDEALARTNKLLGWDPDRDLPPRWWPPDYSALITDHIQAGRVPARGIDWEHKLRPVTPGQVERITFWSRTIYLRKDGPYNPSPWSGMLREAALDWSALKPLVQPEIGPASRRTRSARPEPPLPEAELKDFLVKLQADLDRIPSQEECWAEVRARFPNQVTRARVRKAHDDVFGRQRGGRRRMQSGRDVKERR
jgi:hypothetical protein